MQLPAASISYECNDPRDIWKVFQASNIHNADGLVFVEGLHKWFRVGEQAYFLKLLTHQIIVPYLFCTLLPIKKDRLLLRNAKVLFLGAEIRVWCFYFTTSHFFWVPFYVAMSSPSVEATFLDHYGIYQLLLFRML